MHKPSLKFKAKTLQTCDMNLQAQNNVILNPTDYGRPMKPFFIEIQNVWAWADNLGR